MRILYDHQVFSLQGHGGITRVFNEIVRYMNTQPDVSTDILLGFSRTKADFSNIVLPPGSVVHLGEGFSQRGAVNYAINEVLSGLIAPFRGHYDIYHSTYYRFVRTVRAARTVVTHHDCGPEIFPHLFPNSKKIFQFKRNLFRRADLILCVSNSSRDDLFRFYDVPREKTRIVYNGVSPMVRRPEGVIELQSVISGSFLLYVGSRSPYKNFDELLRVYVESGVHTVHQLLVLGGGPPSVEHLSLVQRLGIVDRVRFVPYASPVLLAEAYASAALLVYPSLYEGFGLPPLEAASLGCASLVATNPATLEVCGDGAFFFAPGDRQDFLRMLVVALEDSDGRAMRIQNAKRLLKTYTWEACGRQTLEAYREIQ